MVIFRLTCRLSYNNITHIEAYAHPLNYFSLSLLRTLWHMVNVPFLSPHMYWNSLLDSVKKYNVSFIFEICPENTLVSEISFLSYFMRNCSYFYINWFSINYFLYFIYHCYEKHFVGMNWCITIFLHSDVVILFTCVSPHTVVSRYNISVTGDVSGFGESVIDNLDTSCALICQNSIAYLRVYQWKTETTSYPVKWYHTEQTPRF